MEGGLHPFVSPGDVVSLEAGIGKGQMDGDVLTFADRLGDGLEGVGVDVLVLDLFGAGDRKEGRRKV